jgi:hypothetical protein
MDYYVALCIKHYLAARPSGGVYNSARIGRCGRVEAMLYWGL